MGSMTKEQKAFWSDFILAGASLELLMVVFAIVGAGLLYGLYRPRFLYSVAGGIDWAASLLGKTIAWFALLMVLQQVLVVIMQSIFKQSTLSLAPFLPAFAGTPQWFSEELRIYNAILVVLGTGFTLVQGGHVRVDLFYGHFSAKSKQIADLIGTLVLLWPVTITIWFFSWFYMWRSISNSGVNLFKWKISFRFWKLEASSNPSGFQDVWLHKVMIPIFALIMFIMGIAIVYRAVAALRDKSIMEEVAARQVSAH